MAAPLTKWRTGLFECCDDINSCCYGFWCCFCLAVKLSGEFGESGLLPLCDICSFGCYGAWGLPLAVPPAGLALRVSVRRRYGIEGSLGDDMAASCFCVWCNWCQMHREVKHRRQTSTAVVNSQPTAVMMSPPVPQPATETGVILARY